MNNDRHVGNRSASDDPQISCLSRGQNDIPEEEKIGRRKKTCRLSIGKQVTRVWIHSGNTIYHLFSKHSYGEEEQWPMVHVYGLYQP